MNFRETGTPFNLGVVWAVHRETGTPFRFAVTPPGVTLFFPTVSAVLSGLSQKVVLGTCFHHCMLCVFVEIKMDEATVTQKRTVQNADNSKRDYLF
jgi:hypothetical protein